jgi:hypothetical protein
MNLSRRWLRSFLQLDARRVEEHISEEAIHRQEDTVLSALQILQTEPGVLLADEVGMGKTYQALGLIACILERNPAAKVLVVTPRPVLNQQWLRVAGRFRAQGFYAFPPASFGVAQHLTSLADACQKHPVVFVPVTVFGGARSRAERGAILQLWFRSRGVAGPTRGAIRSRLERADFQVHEETHFLGRSIDQFTDLNEEAFCRKGEEGDPGLDDLHAEGLDAFTDKWRVARAMDRARFHLVRHLLPQFDLLVVDEAHKLKNPWTVQARAVSQVLGNRFNRAAFLTATPFQLGVHELRQVFRLFSRASAVRPGFRQDVDELFEAITSYQQSYDSFEQSWRYVDPRQASSLATWYRTQRNRAEFDTEGLDDPNVVSLAHQAWQLRKLKNERVESGFRRWTLRSLKRDKDIRRDTQAELIEPSDRSLLPLILYQRLVEERSRVGRRTHIAAVELNISSSFDAARLGSLLSEEAPEPSVRAYQQLVQRVLRNHRGKHPKVEQTVGNVLSNARKGEKSLIFCERNATISVLQRRLERQWMRQQTCLWQTHYSGASRADIFGRSEGKKRIRGEFQKLSTRFSRGQDALSLALRESYPWTLFVPPGEQDLPKALWRDEDALLEESNRILRCQKTSGFSARKPDYRIARRCVDQAVARWFERNQPSALKLWDKPKGEERHIGEALLEDSYHQLGIDRFLDDDEREMLGRADESVEWTLSPQIFRNILARDRPSIWFVFREQLASFPVRRRVQLVDAVRFYLTRREVPFLVQLLGRAGGPTAGSAQLRDTLESWWRRRDCAWRKEVAEFLEYLPRLGKDVEGGDGPSEQEEVLSDALREGRFVQTTLAGDSRTRRQNAFNTPFYPMVLLGNKTMQEGLDLHRHCRRVIHHDLRWNPADLEQRTGRVDRHGSLSRQLEESGEDIDWRIIVRYPILERTHDPHQYQVVKRREKWLDFLLGRPPEVGSATLGEQDCQQLPKELSEDLRVRLEPRDWG